MLFTPPNKILVKSDDNILEYQHTIKKSVNNKEDMFVYKFIKSETKLDTLTMFSEKTLKQLLYQAFKIINE